MSKIKRKVKIKKKGRKERKKKNGRHQKKRKGTYHKYPVNSTHMQYMLIQHPTHMEIYTQKNRHNLLGVGGHKVGYTKLRL